MLDIGMKVGRIINKKIIKDYFVHLFIATLIIFKRESS